MDDPNADTEWNDILRAKGILPPKDEKTKDEIEDLYAEALRARLEEEKSLDKKTLEELDELEDEEDERILLEYRQKRMQEMQDQAMKNKYGSITQISKPEFVQQVTEASKDCSVIVHLYQEYIPACQLMNKHLEELAQQYKQTKFVKIIADQCIPNYPDRNVPTLLVYGNGDIMANLVGAIQFGGMNMTKTGIQTLLSRYNALPPPPSDKNDDDKKKKSIYRTAATAALSSDEDEDDDGYY